MPIEAARCQAIFDQVLRASRALGVADAEAILAAGSSALTRFANNAIHQNVAERSGYLSVRVQIDGRTARATTNRLDDDSIRQVVEESVALTKLQEPDAALLPLTEPSGTGLPACPSVRWHEATARVTPTDRAQAVAEAIAIVEAAGQTAAGIYSTSESVSAILNSRGLFAYYPETMASFSITAMAADSSGWAKGSACSHRDLDPAAMARAAAGKARSSSATISRFTTMRITRCKPARPSMAKAFHGASSRWWTRAWCARCRIAARPRTPPASRPPGTASRCRTSTVKRP